MKSKSYQANNSLIIEASKSKHPTLKCDNVYLHSKYNPVNEGQKLAENLDLTGKKTVIVFGMGLGYHIMPLLDSHLNILIIEYNPAIVDFLKQTNRLNLFQPCKIYFGELRQLEQWFMEQVEQEETDSILFFDHPTSCRLHNQYYSRAKELVNNVLKIKLQSYITTLGFSKRWHENILKNIVHSDSFLTIDKKVDLPVFIVASGVSLDENIAKLREMKDKGILIALLPVYQRLMEENIEPHYVISTDGGIANRIHLFSNQFSPGKTILITTLSANPFIFKKWSGQLLIINQELPLESMLLKGFPTIPMHGTVAAAAFLIAQKISTGSIILVGMDFAFVQGNYHFKGNNLETLLLLSANRLMNMDSKLQTLMGKFKQVQVQGRKGKSLISNLAMQSYLNWFIKEISMSKQNTYTLNQKGAIINGADDFTFSELKSILAMTDINFEPISITQPLSSKAKVNIIDTVQKLLDFYQMLEQSQWFDFDEHDDMDQPFKKIMSFHFSRMIQKKKKNSHISVEDMEEMELAVNRTELMLKKALTIL